MITFCLFNYLLRDTGKKELNMWKLIRNLDFMGKAKTNSKFIVVRIKYQFSWLGINIAHSCG